MGENGEDFPHLPEEDINMKFLSRFLMCQWAGEANMRSRGQWRGSEGGLEYFWCSPKQHMRSVISV